MDITLCSHKIIQIDVVQCTHVDGKWSYVKACNRLIGKVPQREIEPWVWSFFEKNMY
jgi:hypothetical protein